MPEVYALVPASALLSRSTDIPIPLFDTEEKAKAALEQQEGDYLIVRYA